MLRAAKHLEAYRDRPFATFRVTKEQRYTSQEPPVKTRGLGAGPTSSRLSKPCILTRLSLARDYVIREYTGTVADASSVRRTTV
jgi:hypothetical protein